jgi:hypothetical protein
MYSAIIPMPISRYAITVIVTCSSISHSVPFATVVDVRREGHLHVKSLAVRGCVGVSHGVRYGCDQPKLKSEHT